MVVFSEGASASALGVATFQTALISALLLSGLLCDRFGIGVEEKNILRHGALLAHCSPLSPPFLSCRHSGTQPRLSCSLSSPFGRVTRWLAACGNAKVAEATGSMLVSITWNFIVGFCVWARRWRYVSH